MARIHATFWGFEDRYRLLAPGERYQALTPATLVHGDWKAGNLGEHPDGRTILLDWGWPGRATPLALLGGFLQLGWSKTGDLAELDWWLSRVAPVARDLLA